tara:strand:- start:1344 stop:2306 length:963 start_codon:yes stop_codon:yes gene_type:complete
MEERLYLFLGLFFVTIPVFAEPTGGLATAAIISAGVSVLSGIFGGVSAGAAKRRAQRKERAAAGQRMELEANRQDIPTFGQEFENPYSNLQVATRASEIQAEQADISLASTLDTLRATGASAGGATALARAAAQSKRGVSASIEQQEARNAQLRAQGEVQAAQMRQRAEMASFQAQERREMQQLNRQASLESSFNQQAAAYGAQSSQMIGQAVGALGTFAAQGGFGKSGPFAKKENPITLPSGANVDLTTETSKNFNNLYGNMVSSRAQEYINTAPNFGNLPPGQEQVANVFSNVPTNPYASIGISDEYYNTMMQIPVIN